MARNVLLISDLMIKERTSVHGNIDPKLIYPDIKVAQDMYIEPLLGTALYEKLQDLVSSDEISQPANADYKNLIDRFICDALMYYTLSELPTTISYQFWNKGVLRKQGDNTSLPSMSELIDLSNKYKDRAEFYADRLMKYVKQNASTKFPEYLNAGNGMDTIHPENRSFTMPIYLGDDDDCCKFNGQPYKD